MTAVIIGGILAGILTIVTIYLYIKKNRNKEHVVDVFVDHGPLKYLVTYDPARNSGNGSISVSKPVVTKRHKDGTYEYKRNNDDLLNDALFSPISPVSIWHDSSSDWDDNSFSSHNSPAKSDYDSSSSNNSSSSYDSSDSGSSDCGGGDSGD